MLNDHISTKDKFEKEVDLMIIKLFEKDRPHINQIIDSIISKQIKRQSTIEVNLDILIIYSVCINVSKEFNKLNEYYANINREKADEYCCRYVETLKKKEYEK